MKVLGSSAATMGQTPRSNDPGNSAGVVVFAVVGRVARLTQPFAAARPAGLFPPLPGQAA
jgi:hypothetical protein